ncbi:MAG: hypothetical protein ACPL7R_07435 [Anaerolineae bacterium]
MAMSRFTGRQVRARALEALALVLVAAYGLLLLPLPFGRDQGIYAYGGSVVLRGGILYRDTWQNPCPAYLKAHSSPDDFVQVWGFEPGINFLAERFAPTRFRMIWPFLTGPRAHPLLQRWFAEFLAEFDRRPPLYMVVVEQDYNPVQRVDSKTALEWYPAMAERLDGGYGVETVIEHFTLYRRAD